MNKPSNVQSAARQIERILRQSGGLSTLPEVAAELLCLLSEPNCDRIRIGRIIQTDSSLCAKILSLAARERIGFGGSQATIEEAVAHLPIESLREAVLSVKVFAALNWAIDTDNRRLLPRRQLALHSLATACCAEAVAAFVLPPEQRSLAYLAGLLHDIGKTALDETMPKSFERLVRQSRDTGAELYAIEQEHLGLDHAALGKRLAEKWQLPEAILSCIWLHHSDPTALAATLADPKPAAVVALADRLARKCALGQSGSYAQPDDIQEWTAFLKLTDTQLRQIMDELPLAVGTQCEQIQWTPEQSPAAYVTAIQDAAVRLAGDNRSLGRKSQQCDALNGQNTLIQSVLDDICDYHSPVEIAERFAAFWQKQYMCGTTAVYVIGEAAEVPEAAIETAIVARGGQTRICSITPPCALPVVPESLKQPFAIVPVQGQADWLLTPIADQINPAQMRMAPLSLQDKVIGILVFEAMQADAAQKPLECATACRTAAFALRMAQSIQKHANLSEQFVQTLGSLRRARTDLARSQSMHSLAELAAGAAHEMNTPLAVISGRAQLLMDTETDSDRKQMLRQIQQRTEDISQIITDLMSFAKPAKPDKRRVTLEELLAKAVEKSCRRLALAALETELAVDVTQAVYVDAHQIAEAISHIIDNAVQAYPGQNGPVMIGSQPQDGDAMVQLTIRDKGCGMDAAALQKAVEPFFSHRPAGRRRGMGLTHAQRLLQLNGGSLCLSSTPDEGTTVSICLPKP